MDTKRLVLYALMGMICFALWDAWQKDYPAPVPATVVVAASGVSATAAASGNASAGGGGAAGAETAASSAAASSSPAAASTALAALPTSSAATVLAGGKIPQDRLVKIQTDVLDVAIDTLGGSVVQTKLLQYRAEANKPAPVQLFNDDANKLYLAESNLYLTQSDNGAAVGPDTQQKHAQYRAAQHSYVMQPGQQELQVTLQWSGNNGVAVNKIFTFTRGHYDIKVGYAVNNKSQQALDGVLQAQLQRKDIHEPETGSKLQYGTFAGAAFSSPEKLYEKVNYKKLAKENISREVQGGWMALQQRYFLSAWVPNKAASYNYSSAVELGEIYQVKLVGDKIKVPAGATANVNATLYVGPEITDTLKALAPGLDLTIDYGWLWIISVFIFWIMQHIQRVIGNWGWSIVLVTVLIKAAFFKLSEVSYRSMAKMKDLAPKLQMLKERCGDDRQKLSQATMELYKKEKVNPMSGCLPMIVQIPVFIGLYYVLLEAVQLRHAPFIFWLHDLSAKDPYYILPILMGISMVGQQLLSPQSPDPVQSKMMMALPVVFTFFFLSFPSGLVLYWLINNVLSIAQQWYINKKYAHVSAVTVPSNIAALWQRFRKK